MSENIVLEVEHTLRQLSDSRTNLTIQPKVVQTLRTKVGNRLSSNLVASVYSRDYDPIAVELAAPPGMVLLEKLQKCQTQMGVVEQLVQALSDQTASAQDIINAREKASTAISAPKNALEHAARRQCLSCAASHDWPILVETLDCATTWETSPADIERRLPIDRRLLRRRRQRQLAATIDHEVFVRPCQVTGEWLSYFGIRLGDPGGQGVEERFARGVDRLPPGIPTNELQTLLTTFRTHTQKKLHTTLTVFPSGMEVLGLCDQVRNALLTGASLMDQLSSIAKPEEITDTFVEQQRKRVKTTLWCACQMRRHGRSCPRNCER